MSGYFILSRDLLDRTVRRLSGRGFKILLDIFLSSERAVRFAEIPYTMRSGVRGDSKLDTLVAWEFVMLLLDKLVGRFIPIRFIMCVTVGLVGATGHIAVLGLMTRVLDHRFLVGQAVATVVAMTINFFSTICSRRAIGNSGAGGLFPGWQVFISPAALAGR